jgi:hypothetical protein
MRRIPDVPAGGFLFCGKRYRTQAEYLEAVRKQKERRARILARIGLERGQLLSWPGQDEREESDAAVPPAELVNYEVS